jgi:hypothetical protein
MSMGTPSPEDRSPDIVRSTDLRHAMGQATERIHEIIDTAERVAAEIRADAEADARSYLAERKREADLVARERTSVLDQLTRTLADSAEQFKHQAERMLADLDRVIAEARAGVYASGAAAAVEAEPAAAPTPTPPPRPVPEPATEPQSADATSEALLRATQMAVTGKGRAEIAEVLRADFPGVDTDSVVDEILG